MGQYRLSRRIARQRYYEGIGQPIVASCYKGLEVTRISLTKKQLIKNRIGLGIYLIEIIGDKSIRFIRELREVMNQHRIEVSIPTVLSDNFTHKQRVNVTLTKLNRDEFFKKVKDSMARLYDLDRIKMKGDTLLFHIKGKKLEFHVLNYRYQQQCEYTGAYISFEGPLPAKQQFKIGYDGFGEPSFFIYDKDGYRKIQSFSYDLELLVFHVKYLHDKSRVNNRFIHLGKTISDIIEIKELFEQYFQAKSNGLHKEMGVAGTAIVVEVLKDMGYRVVWSDSIGNTEGPDISLFDADGNKITTEVKSTSILVSFNSALNEAIDDIEQYYFDLNHSNEKFLWHTVDNKLRYEADYALAVAIYLDEYYKTVDMKMRRITVVTSEGEAMFNRTTLTWRTDHIG